MTGRLLVLTIAWLSGCASPEKATKPEVLAPVPPLTAQVSERELSELREISPRLARAVERLAVAQQAARGQGNTAAQLSLSAAADELLLAAQTLDRARSELAQCRADGIAETPAEETPSSSPRKRKRRPAVAPDKPDQEAPEAGLDQRLRGLAVRIEALGEADPDKTGRVRLENARQLLLQANRSHAKGLVANATRLLERAEYTLDSSVEIADAPNEALKEDARRLFGPRLQMSSSGILIGLGDGRDPIDPDLLDRLERFVEAYQVHPVLALGSVDNAQAQRALARLVPPKRRPPPRATAQLNSREADDLDGVWLWVGYAP